MSEDPGFEMRYLLELDKHWYPEFQDEPINTRYIWLKNHVRRSTALGLHQKLFLMELLDGLIAQDAQRAADADGERMWTECLGFNPFTATE